jgi:hypothetical protein
MPMCDRAHQMYDRIHEGTIQNGALPEWTRVHGRVAWTVSKGPYSKLPGAWQAFMGGVMNSKTRPTGPTGDVYACNPADHPGEDEARLLTLLYVPID